MGSELEVLKKIWENNEKTSIKLISNQTGFGPDYIRYLCRSLSKKGHIRAVKNKPAWYEITAKGKKALGRIAETEIWRKGGKIRKIILSLPIKLLRLKSQKSKLAPVEEKKLKLGRKIEKAVSFLRRV